MAVVLAIGFAVDLAIGFAVDLAIGFAVDFVIGFGLGLAPVAAIAVPVMRKPVAAKAARYFFKGTPPFVPSERNE